jgi:hypothetical protein
MIGPGVFQRRRTMTTTTNATHTVAERICVASGCRETGVLVELHTRPARSDPTLTDVTLRWRCRARHAWQDTYAHDGSSTIIETVQVR